MILYSFVIITYNYKEYLVNCLVSLNRQVGFSADEYEVVVVDDGSNDGTYEKIKKLYLTYNMKYIYIGRTKKSCRNAARNKGWKNAQGERIVFLDADMIVKKDYLQNLHMCYMMSPDISVVGMRFMLVEPVNPGEVEDGSIYDQFNMYKPEMKYMEERHYYFNKLSYNPGSFTNMWLYFHSCNICVPKKYLMLTEGFNENLPGWGFDDQELGYKLEKAGVRIVLNQKMEGLHQYHGEVYGTLRNPDKVREQHNNISIIYKSHPEIKKVLPKWKLLVFGYLKMHTKMNELQKRKKKKYVIELKSASHLKEIKDLIRGLIATSDKEIVVFDYLENTDFHIWVQFLETTNVKYFPISRILDKDSIIKHRRYLKKAFHGNRLVWKLQLFFHVYIKPLTCTKRKANPISKYYKSDR